MHAFHPVPLYLRHPSSESVATTTRSFSTCFVFAIVSPYDELSSHGLAFVVASTSNLSTANAGQYLGLLNATNGTTAAASWRLSSTPSPTPSSTTSTATMSGSTSTA